MLNRTQKVVELMEGFRSLQGRTFRSLGTGHLPRVTPAQWRVLAILEHSSERTVKDLSKTLGITSSAATQLVDGLVASKYVQREHNKDDRRTVRLVLTKKTKTEVVRMKKQVVKSFLELFEVLNDKEFAQYLLLNKKIVDRFSKK